MIDQFVLALGLVMILAAPPYLSYHLARRKGRRALAWALGAFLAALFTTITGLLIGGWLVVAILIALPTSELHPDV